MTRTRPGSTRRWRRIRAAVLTRDRYTCQHPQPWGICGRVATDAAHIVPWHLGGTDTMTNLRAECTKCNRGEGHAISAAGRR